MATLNAVAPEPISVKELAELILVRYPTEVVFGRARPGDVPPAFVSSVRIADVLGWKAETPFSHGLSALMDSLADGA